MAKTTKATDAPKIEKWWVCEMANSLALRPLFWCGGSHWSYEYHDARILKYTSKEEATEAGKDAPHAVRVFERAWEAPDDGDSKID